MGNSCSQFQRVFPYVWYNYLRTRPVARSRGGYHGKRGRKHLCYVGMRAGFAPAYVARSEWIASSWRYSCHYHQGNKQVCLFRKSVKERKVSFYSWSGPFLAGPSSYKHFGSLSLVNSVKVRQSEHSWWLFAREKGPSFFSYERSLSLLGWEGDPFFRFNFS